MKFEIQINDGSTHEATGYGPMRHQQRVTFPPCSFMSGAGAEPRILRLILAAFCFPEVCKY
jgi:hypothetical protein